MDSVGVQLAPGYGQMSPAQLILGVLTVIQLPATAVRITGMPLNALQERPG